MALISGNMRVLHLSFTGKMANISGHGLLIKSIPVI
jgi:hypothetical protein